MGYQRGGAPAPPNMGNLYGRPASPPPSPSAQPYTPPPGSRAIDGGNSYAWSNPFPNLQNGAVTNGTMANAGSLGQLMGGTPYSPQAVQAAQAYTPPPGSRAVDG